MKAMFALYHDYNFEARAPELVKALMLLGVTEISMVTYEKPANLPNVKTYISRKGTWKYFHFINKAIKCLKTEKPDIVLLHDNTTSPILAYLVQHHFKGVIIYDSSELYIDRIRATSLKLFIAKIMPYYEKKYLKEADIVIAANNERAEIMKDYYSLDDKPLVLNNIHRIEDSYDEYLCNSKYSSYIGKDTFLVAYGGGVYSDRRTIELAQAIIELGNNYTLLIAGPGDDDEIGKLNLLIDKHQSRNVYYLGKLPRGEWRYVTTISKCSVSLFPEDTPNNIYCASGKFYESVLEGIPVIASENPPFKNACDEYGFGISSNDLVQSLTEMRENYSKYKENAVLFSRTYDYKGRIDELVKQITERLSKGNEK